jgi:very-short-patch-repair endonuclease
MYTAGRWFEVDCLWREARLVVELDGRATHDTRAAFERDRLRDRMLQVAGWRVIRITWRQLQDSPAEVAADLLTLLGPSCARAR